MVFFWDAIFQGLFAVSCGELYSFFLGIQIHRLTQKIAGFLWWKTPPTGGWSTFMPLVAACSSAQVTLSMMVLVKGIPAKNARNFQGSEGFLLEQSAGEVPQMQEKCSLDSGFEIRITLPRSFFFLGGPVPHDGLGKSAMWKKVRGKFPNKTQWRDISSNFSLRKLWSVVFSSFLNGLFSEEMVGFSFLRLELANVPTANDLPHLYRLVNIIPSPCMVYLPRHVVQ